MIWWVPFFISLLWAEDSFVEKYCFPSMPQLNSAEVKLRGILVPSDRITKDENCLVITMLPHRRELMQSYLRSINPDVSVSYSSAEIQREPCLLKIEKVADLADENLNGELGKTSSLSATSTIGKGNEVLEVQTQKNFELTVDQDSIEGECRFITPHRYEIKIAVKKEAKPISPTLPPGTVVIVNTPPPDQKTMLLKTQLQLQRGEKIEIGKIISELKNKSHEVNASPEFKTDRIERVSTMKVFLSIN